MNSFEFSLTYMVPVIDDMELYVDRLADATNDDAIIGISDNGRLTLDFEKEGNAIFALVEQAIYEVKSEVPEAKLVEVTPDLVGITELAAMLDVTRQAARKMWEKNMPNFPAPIKYGNGMSPIWHMASVLDWMDKSDKYETPDGMLEVAKIAMKQNLIKAQKELNSLGVEIESASIDLELVVRRVGRVRRN